MADRTLQQFLNELSDNTIRNQAQYEIEVYSGYTDVDSVLANITMYAENFPIPGRTQNFAELFFRGYPIPIPTNFTMTNEHTFSVYADMQGNNRKGFLRWMSYTTNPAINSGSTMGGDKRIAKNSFIRAKLLSDDMSSNSEIYKICGIKVQNVGELVMANNGTELAKFDVTIKSVLHEIDETTGKLIGQK